METYNVKVVCKNCGFNGEINIPKGKKVEKYPCTKCGTVSLVRNVYEASPKTEKDLYPL